MYKVEVQHQDRSFGFTKYEPQDDTSKTHKKLNFLNRISFAISIDYSIQGHQHQCLSGILVKIREWPHIHKSFYYEFRALFRYITYQKKIINTENVSLSVATVLCSD